MNVLRFLNTGCLLAPRHEKDECAAFFKHRVFVPRHDVFLNVGSLLVPRHEQDGCAVFFKHLAFVGPQA